MKNKRNLKILGDNKSSSGSGQGASGGSGSGSGCQVQSSGSNEIDSIGHLTSIIKPQQVAEEVRKLDKAQFN